jgi:hypothetical protein
MVYGNPARLHAFACPCGARLPQTQVDVSAEPEKIPLVCRKCGATVMIPHADYGRMIDRLELP